MNRSLSEALSFYCDFDAGFDAVSSRGEAGARLDVDAYPPRHTTGGGGRFGEAAEFVYGEQRDSIWTHDVLRYPALGNFPYRDSAFAGTIGMWLQVDLAALRSRPLIWLDPVHLLGPEAKSLGKMWMDIVVSELPGSPLFRYGATLPRSMRRDPDRAGEGHVLTVPELTFTGDEWHQVIGTWSGINGGPDAGRLDLYFDGVHVGRMDRFEHRLEWRLDDWEIRIGLGFAGRIDDFFILDRELSAQEADELHAAQVPFGQFCAGR